MNKTKFIQKNYNRVKLVAEHVIPREHAVTLSRGDLLTLLPGLTLFYRTRYVENNGYIVYAVLVDEYSGRMCTVTPESMEPVAICGEKVPELATSLAVARDCDTVARVLARYMVPNK